jgi:hypothetical protein
MGTEAAFRLRCPKRDRCFHGISKTNRLTLMMPACVTVDVIGMIDPLAGRMMSVVDLSRCSSGLK